MNETKIMRCPEDGGDVRLVAAPGRLYRHKTMLLELPEDVAVPTCSQCGEEYIDAALATRIDDALSALYKIALKDKVQNALEALAPFVRQNHLEALLGVSHGYLSKLKTGEKEPSPYLVAILEMLANDPRRRILELEAVWGADTSEDVPRKVIV